eukprot:CAMPEP_0201700830 /NCGR_PEP_ID=MMETSP0578-20130828/30118_1 /ASSEMBLY_ACC=CAM_ASM_000663 /TAXON_ID=267565 /ORGANISM="Skeletonema grethea, Strain CCMP 1804" /LENGTH=338 /DNA_ID=CAMNT_0048187981 /DNA_START=58 /DNA_END=1074 /DNA_ORIENTATION=-
MPNKKKRKAPTPAKAAAAPPVWTVTGAELVKAFQHIIYSLPKCHDQWFTDEDWCSILPDYWASLKNYRDQVTKGKFIKAIKKHFGEISGYRGETNPSGVYCVERARMINGKNTKNWCFLITKKLFCPLPPSSPQFFIGDITTVLEPLLPQYQPTSSRGLANEILKESYFDSGEAWKMFMPSDVAKPKKNDPGKSTGDDVKAVIKTRMLACQAGIQNFWEAIEDGTKEDVTDVTDFKRRKIVFKCHAVYAALRKALESMEGNQNRLTWRQCCDFAVEAMKVVGFEETLAADAVSRAHVEFRDNKNKFKHPNEKARKKKAAKEEEEEEEDVESEDESASD